jgi:hypothetical protein
MYINYLNLKKGLVVNLLINFLPEIQTKKTKSSHNDLLFSLFIVSFMSFFIT